MHDIEANKPPDIAPSIEPVLPSVIPDAISLDLSELPDASFTPVGEETLDQLADLPPIPATTGRRQSRAPSLGPLTSPRKASRAPSLGPLTSPRKASRPPSRRNSRAPSVQPSVVETNGALDPSSALAPSHGRTSRRSSRAPSLGPAATSSAFQRTVVTEEITEVISVTESSGPGATFTVPEETGDSSLFLGNDFSNQFEDAQMHGGLYPDLPQNHGHDDNFSL